MILFIAYIDLIIHCRLCFFTFLFSKSFWTTCTLYFYNFDIFFLFNLFIHLSRFNLTSTNFFQEYLASLFFSMAFKVLIKSFVFQTWSAIQRSSIPWILSNMFLFYRVCIKYSQLSWFHRVLLLNSEYSTCAKCTQYYHKTISGVHMFLPAF